MNAIPVTPDMPVEELVDAYPAAIRFLAERNILCVVCGEAFWGTLGQLIDQKQPGTAEAIVAELNAYLDDQQAVRAT